MLLDILSRLGSNCRGLACYSISYHALAVSAEAWHATRYPITLWQYLPRLVSTDMVGKGSGAYFMRMVQKACMTMLRQNLMPSVLIAMTRLQPPEETESRRTESDDDGTGANQHVPAGAAQKRHRVNELHEALRRIADLEARLKVSDVENFVQCKSC